MGFRLAATLMVAMIALGLIGGWAVVAASSTGAPQHLTNCNPVISKADWLLDKESSCLDANEPTR